MRNFSYKILRVDEAAANMDVEYTADGYRPVLVGVRAPRQGEALESVILAFAPEAVWDSVDLERTPLALPQVGLTGRVEILPPIVEEPVPAEVPPEVVLRRVTL